MADVLSQAQIDALLNAVRSGDKDLENSGEKQEKKYLKYDFSSPRKFTKDRIKMLNGIFDNYTRVISSRLNAQLRTSCEITVESVEEQKFYEFNNALLEGDVLAMVNVTVHSREENGADCIYVETHPDEAGYRDRYWVSMDSGLLTTAERLYHETVVYRFTASAPDADLPDETLFLLPDGSPPER